MNWSQAIDGFGRHLGVERGLSPNTRRAYESDVRQLTVHTGAEIAPAEVDADHIRAWLASLHRRRSPATRGRKLASARSFFRWLVREGVRRDDPTAGLPMPKLEKRLPRPLSIDDCEQLITKDRRVLNQPAPEGAIAPGAPSGCASGIARSSSSSTARESASASWSPSTYATSSCGPRRSA